MKEATWVSSHFNAGISGDKEMIEMIIWLYETRKRVSWRIARALNCNTSTVCRILKRNKIPLLPHVSARNERHWNWQGGKTKTAEYIRFTPEYKQWRKAVFERDDYTCQICGKKGGKLVAHHIKEQSNYPELRIVLDNGQTLCKGCHKLTDNYGSKAKKMN
jgi:IS30 family transposase